MWLLKIFAFILLFANLALGADGTLTGIIRTPQTSSVIANGSLQLTLSQAGVVAGSATLSTSSINCATSTDGSIVAVRNPLTGPSLAASAAGGSLSGTYYVKYAYYDATGTSLPSPASVIVISGGDNRIVVTAPASVTGATGYKVYMSATQGSELLIATTVGFISSTNITDVGSGALPSTNTTACKMTFNDAIIPTSTKYRVNLVDRNNAQVPGFPFFIVLTGTSVDVSNGWPIANNIETRYITPIISSPLSNATQSVNSPLTLNGYMLTAGALELPNNASPPATQAGRTFIYTDNAGTAYLCQNGSACVQLVGAVTGAGWVDGGANIYTLTATDRVMVGLGTSSGDFSGAGYNGSLLALSNIIAASAATNASTLGFAVGATAGIVSGITGSGTQLPISITVNTAERARYTTSGQYLVGLTSYSGTASIVGASNIVSSAGGTNSDFVSMLTSAGSYVAIASGKIGSNTGLPLAIRMYDDAATSDVEVARFERVNDLAGTGRNFNLEIGSSITSTYNYLIYAKRDQNTASAILVENLTAGTEASASLRAVANAAQAFFGVTSASFTPASGLEADTAFIFTGSDVSGGISFVTPNSVHLVATLGMDIPEVTAPAAPAANTGRLYVDDNGSGKSRLNIRFASGAVQVIATEP